jgi:hypothetical protein
MSTAEHVYFADLNCPFCYALDERIHELGLTSVVSWQGVQHLITTEQWQSATMARLSEEVTRVRQRAPGLAIEIPRRLPSSGLAILNLAELALTDRAGSVKLRRALYAALWVEGRDISSSTVIRGVCGSLAIAPPRPSANARSLTERWQRDWERGNFERRIPVLVAPGGARSVGLEESRRVAAFLKAGLLSSENADACQGPERE